jgi:hypothetical protein
MRRSKNEKGRGWVERDQQGRTEKEGKRREKRVRWSGLREIEGERKEKEKKRKNEGDNGTCVQLRVVGWR